MNKTSDMSQPCQADLHLKYRILQLNYSRLRVNCHGKLITHHELLVKYHRQRAECSWIQDTWTDSIHSDVSQQV